MNTRKKLLTYRFFGFVLSLLFSFHCFSVLADEGNTETAPTGLNVVADAADAVAAVAALVPSLDSGDPLSVTVGWYHWDPYQYLDANGRLTGLDFALVKEIFDASGIAVTYDEGAKDSWSKNQQDVLHHKKDVAAGAFKTPIRSEKYHVSQPYRYEWNSLYVRHADASYFIVSSVSELLALIDEDHKIGVIKGYRYTSEALNTYIEEQLKKGSSSIVTSITEEENFNNLYDGNVSIVAADRLVGARIMWKNQTHSTQISELPVTLPALPIHLLIHKSDNQVVNERMKQVMSAFNNGIVELTASGAIQKTIGNYLFPVLMNITVQRDWFSMIDLVGAVFFAIAGLLIARDNKYDLFGVFVMTALLTTGGGLMRDIFVGRDPVILRYPEYIIIVLSVAVIGFVLCWVHDYLQAQSPRYQSIAQKQQAGWFFVRHLIEAMALGAYTVVGVGVAVEMKLSPLWLWGPILGCVTACGGGILANALRQGEEIKAMKGSLDPECTLFWGSIFTWILIWQADRLNPNEVMLGVVVTLVGTTVTVLLVNHFKWRSPALNYIKQQ
jgi:polar amino acid transport system substrate-binding protein